jgi:DNA-binding transcriptional MerR regulator
MYFGAASGGPMGTGIQGSFDEVGGETGYGGPEVWEIVDITYRQLDYWDRTDLLKPSLATAQGSGTQRRYSYRDLVKLKVIKGLLDAGVRLQTARTVIDSLRDDLGDDWQTANLVIDGTHTVLARDGEQLVDLMRKGQGVLNVVPVGNMVQELEAAIHRLAPREAAKSMPAGERHAAQGG